MNIGQRMRCKREKLKYTLEEVADKIGISRQTLSRYETGIISNIPSDKIELLAKVLEVTPSYLMGWENDRGETDIVLVALDIQKRTGCGIDEAMRRAEIQVMTEQIGGLERVPDTIRVPILGDIACGDPITAIQCAEESVIMPERVHADFALRCKGDSMIGARIYDGDLVYIRQQQTIENGEIAAVMIDGEATLKRVKRFPDHIVLAPENPNYRPLSFWDDEMDTITIIGKAVAFLSTVH